MNFKLFSRTSASRLGLEFSSEGIIAIQLSEAKKQKSLEKLSRRIFESGSVVQGGQIIDESTFIKVLSSMIIDDGLNAKTVHVSVPSSAAFIKTITLPDLPVNELRAIVMQESENHISFPLEEVNIDIDIIESSRRSDEDGKKIDVVLAALPKTVSKNIVEIMSKVGLKVESIDISAFSAIRTLANAGFIDESDSISVSVLIGYENTDINILQKGMPVFSNNLPIGKKNLIESLKIALDMDIMDLENLLPEVALIIPGSSILQEGLAVKASTLAKNVYNLILLEVEKTIDFYQSQVSCEVEIKNIIISGTGICIQNIDKYFINRLKIYTLMCDSLKNIETSIVSTENLIYPINVPSMASVMGLALRGL
ncbi:MAG: type IV pilus assembly protein PilM [bacterium]